jgi:hypothetical protein
VTREVVWDHGVSLPEHSLWLDPLVVRAFAFISHAHTDHARRHKEALLTPQTLALIPEARRPRGWRMLGYDEPMRRGPATVTLHPAGPMLGPALRFEHEGTTFYTPATSSCANRADMGRRACLARMCWSWKAPTGDPISGLATPTRRSSRSRGGVASPSTAVLLRYCCATRSARPKR